MTGKGDLECWANELGTVVPRAEGGFLCAGDSGIYFLDPDSGES